MSELNPETTAEPEDSATEAVSPEASGESPAMDFSQLPAYSRTLLKIKVPVRVVLASRKEDLKDIVEISPGSIIKFDKACDELLDLHVADQLVAECEAIKIGDKFGFRVLSMLMPEEHFLRAEATKAG